MTPGEFVKKFVSSPGPSSGDFYDAGPLTVDRGDKVGVVLMSEGGADRAEDVEAVLYRRISNLESLPVALPEFLWTRVARIVARRRADHIRVGYEQIGGTCPQNQRTRDQAQRLQARLNDRFGTSLGLKYRTYIATLAAEGGFQTTLAELNQDGVDRVVLLPLYPQVGRSTTDAMVRNWHATEKAAGSSRRMPTAVVPAFGEHSLFVQSVSERIDEALQRFPRHVRKSVPLVFSAPATPRRNLTKHRDPYLKNVQTTARTVMAHRSRADAGRPFHVAFHQRHDIGKPIGPSREDKLEQLVEDGHAAVLIVSVGTISDRVETLYGLDFELRQTATAMGFERFEVTNGLNTHTLFIDALAKSVAAQLRAVQIPSDEDAVSRPVVRRNEVIDIEMLLASEISPAHNRSKAA